MTSIVNLMPYPAVIGSKAGDGQITILRQIPKSSNPAKVVTHAVESGTILGVPTVRVTYGAPVNLPEPQNGVAYIVFPAVAEAQEEISRKTVRTIVQSTDLTATIASVVGEFLGSCRSDLIGMDTNRAIRNKEGAIIGSPAFVRFSEPEKSEAAQKQESTSVTAQSTTSQSAAATTVGSEVTSSFVNLTPHDVDIIEVVDEQVKKKMVIPRSGTIVRVAAETIPADDVDSLPSVHIKYGKVIDMPPSKAGVTYVASMLIGQALQGQRNDIVSPDPDTLVREGSKILGVQRLIRY